MTKRSKITCPKCQSTNIADILYGEVAFDEKLNEALTKGKIHLGGCCWDPNAPEYHCNQCGENFSENPHLSISASQPAHNDDTVKKALELLKNFEHKNKKHSPK